MQHPAIGTIHGFSRFAPGFTHFLNQLKERFVQFAEVGYLRRPIVHFEVDVARIFTFIIKNIEIDPKIWQFPVIAYINFDGFSSRMGETTIQIFNIMPVNQIPTIESFKIKEQKFGDMWVNNLQNEIDLEQRVLAAEAKGVNI
jgi:hypothetical protein